MKGFSCYFLALLLLTGMPHAFSQAQNKKALRKANAALPAGLQDRAYWSTLLYKIAAPVLTNLANGTLKAAMPLELGPGYGMDPKKVTYGEAVGRTVSGIAPWLALPDDSSAEGGMRKELRMALLKGLVHAFDPTDADYLNFRTENQPIVDAAFLAHGFLRAPEQLWEPLDIVTKKRIIEEFQSLRNRKPYYSNWLLFAGITEAFLMKIGAGYDPMRMDIAFKKIKEWYVGDGWYMDGEHFAMDYYNAFVIHPMMVDMLKVMVEFKLAKPQDHVEAVKRMVRYAEVQERFIAPDGTYPPFGRSITYRNAAFQPLAQVCLMNQLPESIQPAQVRSAFTAMMHKLFDISGTFDNKGWLQLGLAGHQPSSADTYTSTGSLYMCTMGFLPLGLPSDHPFWSAPPADWTSKKAWSGQPLKKDYKVDY